MTTTIGPTSGTRSTGASGPVDCSVSGVARHAVAVVRGRGAARERAICTAMLDLLNEVSYESVTMDAVAARAKASKATIYRRWSNKEELVLRAIQLEMDENPFEAPDTGTLAGDLTSFLLTQSEQERCAFNTAAMRGLTYATANDPELGEMLRSVMEEAGIRVWQVLLDRALERGELAHAVDPALPLAVTKAMFFCRMGLETEPMDASYVDTLVHDVLMPVVLHQSKTSSPAAVGAP